MEFEGWWEEGDVASEGKVGGVVVEQLGEEGATRLRQATVRCW